MARFAVCIPVYNGAAFVGQALESVARQTLGDVEVIVSDNASTDGTAEILDRWSQRLNMRIIRRPATMPMQAHFNALLDAVDSEAYMLLCHDDYLARPDALALAHDALVVNPDVSAVYCDLEYVNEFRRRLAGRRFGRRGPFDADAVGRATLLTTRNCFGIPLAVRRSALGPLRYDPTFHYVMDVDLSWSLSRERPAWHIAEPLIANRYSGVNTTWSLLASARREYIDLAAKYGHAMDRFDRVRLSLTNFNMAQQKRLFGVYERIVSWSA